MPRPQPRSAPPNLLRGRPDPIFVVPFEQGEIGPDLFWAALSVSAPPLLAEG
jgi:hypothetical protein